MKVVLFQACPNLLKLNLMYCTSIMKLSDVIGQSSRLQELDLTECRKLKEIPRSIGQLKALTFLNLSGCSSLKALPDTIGDLSNLRYLSLRRCVSVSDLPKSIWFLSNLRWLYIDVSTKCRIVSDGTGEGWTKLTNLNIYNCDGLETFLDWGALNSLETLAMFDGAFCKLPGSTGRVTRLERLNLVRCKELHDLPESIEDLKMLRSLVLIDCQNLETLPAALGALSNLSSLVLQGCRNLQKLPTSIRQLKSLRSFNLEDCGCIEALGALTTLQGLEIWGCTSITKLPSPIELVSRLQVEFETFDPEWDSIFSEELQDAEDEVLEKNACGYLEASQATEGGVISLRRFHTVGFPSKDLCKHYHITEPISTKSHAKSDEM